MDTKHATGPNVGDILFYDVGWSMQLPHFAIVTKRTPQTYQTVVLKNQTVRTDDSYGFAGYVVPDCDVRTPETYTNRIRKGGTLYVGNHYARIWDGTPKRFDHMD